MSPTLGHVDVAPRFRNRTARPFHCADTPSSPAKGVGVELILLPAPQFASVSKF